MLYFIPAWYQHGQWSENEQKWHARRMHTEFDDTVKQIQLFHRSKAYPYEILLLSYAPNFRHFLHRQSLFLAPYWSCFDSIQEVRKKKVEVFSYHNLNWPDNTDFVYTPFAVLALINGEKYAMVEFGEDGNPISIDIFRDKQLYRRNIYDDRGFVSSTIVYENGKEQYQDYLMEDGYRKMRVFLDDGHVEINPEKNTYIVTYNGKELQETFARMRYSSLTQIIREVFSTYITFTEKEDVFCLAMHNRHMDAVREMLRERKTVLSFFEDRYDVTKYEDAKECMSIANYIVTDSKNNSLKIKNYMGEEACDIIDITPYDTRKEFGISQHLTVQKMLVPVDGMEEEVFEKMILLFAAYMEENENAQVVLFTRLANFDRKSVLLSKVKRILTSNNYNEGLVESGAKKQISENNIDDSDEVPEKFFVEQCVDELEVSKCIREQRLIVDLRKNPTLYLQISGVSYGIPQIVRTETQYVINGKNGYVLESLDKLPETLDYYLKVLNNWNEAMIHAYEIGEQYTTVKLIEQWKEVLDSIG